MYITFAALYKGVETWNTFGTTPFTLLVFLWVACIFNSDYSLLKLKSDSTRGKHLLTSTFHNETTDEENINDIGVGEIATEMVVQSTSKRPKLSQPLTLFSTANVASDANGEPEVLDTSKDLPSSWLMPEIVVKINSSKVGPGLKNEKAVVVDVDNDHADLILLKSGQDIHGVPSKRLETVIPRIGKKVMILGFHKRRGSTGTVEAINVADSQATIRFDNGDIAEFEFEDISKIFDEDSAD